MYRYPTYDDRFVPFVVPFLLGGLGGAAIVGLSRPRPVFYTPTPQMQQIPPMMPMQQGVTPHYSYTSYYSY